MVSELNKIKIECLTSNRKSTVKISESCLFRKQRDGCKLNNEIKCRFGLTEIKVPEKCPLREDDVLQTFSVGLIKEEIEF